MSQTKSKPYPAYKPSGVEWLGDVPEHWGTRRVKNLFEIRKRISGTEGYEVLSITQQGIKVKDIESGDGQLSMDYSKYQIVEIGDFAMNHMDLLTGYVDISSVFGVTSPDYRVFSVRDKEVCFDQYYLYLFQMGYKNKIFYAFGQGSSQLGRWRFPTEEFNSFVFPHPSIEEQKQISAFLDHETAKIDKLIAEQRRLIDLLKEKRQAVISHAVTKGLSPDAPMKDSGIEWLGEVPAHWEVKRIRFVADLNPSKSEITEISKDTLVSFLPMEAVGDDGTLNLGRAKPIGEVESGYTYFREGDVTIAKITPCYENGKGAVMKGLLNGIGFGTTELIVIRPKETEVTGEYLQHLFTSSLFRNIGESYMYGAGGQKRVPDYFVRNFVMAFPSIEEQTVIAKFLKNSTLRFDELTSQAERAIELLQERRTALISAAVTGKIDVRNIESFRAGTPHEDDFIVPDAIPVLSPV
jgi:type I restriction enzyme S subunit